MAEGDDRSSRLPAILRGEARHPSVQAMERRADGKPGWTLTLQEGEKSEREDFDFVSFATGPLSEKHVPTYPGKSRFLAQGGQVMLSVAFTDPSIAKGKHVAVLGDQKSAADMAVNAANHGRKSSSLV